MLTNIGLVLIIFAWIFQFVKMVKNGKTIRPAFVALYAVGVLLLVIDGFMSGFTVLASLNLVSFVAALAVFFISLPMI
jgi:membrane-bound ClpP family serine protease